MPAPEASGRPSGSCTPKPDYASSQRACSCSPKFARGGNEAVGPGGGVGWSSPWASLVTRTCGELAPGRPGRHVSSPGTAARSSRTARLTVEAGEPCPPVALSGPGDLELHPLVLVLLQAAEARSLDRREMDEDVGAS